MSSYVSTEQILGAISRKDLVGLTDDNSTGDIDQTVLDQAIENASTDIDGLVGNIYDTPFNPVPPTISNYALAIVCYQLMRRRLIPDEKNIFYPQYKDTMDFLMRVNIGEAHIAQVPERSFPQGAITGRSIVYGMGNVLSNSM